MSSVPGNLRIIELSRIEEQIYKLFLEASYKLPGDIKKALNEAALSEDNSAAKNILDIVIKNYDKSAEMEYPLCQDTGMAVIFMEIGQDVHFSGGSLHDAVARGVERAYEDGYLRKSVVTDPLRRVNSGNNLPPVIHTELVKGDKVKMTVIPKGFGAENQSAIKMMLPSSSKEDVMDFIVNGVIASGGKGCPPSVIGVGIGGTFEYSAFLAKKALLTPLDQPHPDPFYKEMEEELTARINASNIGPLGIGGKTTTLGVKILSYATHIAGLPVAYNYCCHSCRHHSTTI